MDTRTVTPLLLSGRLGAPPQYGTTAAEVLATSALIAEAQQHWNSEEVAQFQEEAGIHEKVWGRLLAIHRCNRWQEVNPSDLPGTYTALYAITTLSDEAWRQLIEKKVLRSTLSSRNILSWANQVKTGLSELPKQLPMILACSDDKTNELKMVVEKFKAIAQEHGMIVMFRSSSTRGISTGATPEQIMAAVSHQLIPLLREPLNDAGKVLKDTLSIQTEEDLISASVRDFLKFINRTAGSASAALQSYGIQYCLKLALEYNRVSNTRANRSNYKKKLEEIASGDPDSQVTRAAKEVIHDFVE